MKLPLLLLLVAAPVASAEYSVLYEFDTSSTDRPEGWVLSNTNDGTNVEMTGDGFRIIPGSNTQDARNFIIIPFPAVNLEKDGDFIAMNFTLRTESSPEQNGNIRFGLFDSGPIPLKEDSRGPDHTSLRDDAGFYFRLATHPSSNEGRVSRYYFSDGQGQTAALTSNFGRQDQLGEENMTGAMVGRQTKKVEFILTRQGNSLEFKVLFDGNLQSEGRKVENPFTFRFNQAVFSVRHPETDVRISDLIIEANGRREE